MKTTENARAFIASPVWDELLEGFVGEHGTEPEHFMCQDVDGNPAMLEDDALEAFYGPAAEPAGRQRRRERGRRNGQGGN